MKKSEVFYIDSQNSKPILNLLLSFKKNHVGLALLQKLLMKKLDGLMQPENFIITNISNRNPKNILVILIIQGMLHLHLLIKIIQMVHQPEILELIWTMFQVKANLAHYLQSLINLANK